ncbi:NAD(P)/FAD-dependent oxidoreductase [Reyranella sp.]|uniref:NAD(P)/FAD-dependent oxidoreductase n=1 Tax=Reyranella sp. TaxID=1929291 RepID=UPI003D0B47CA
MTVIGAGIVGVCCALHLQREGFKVRLVEKGEPGMKTSFGNSGSFGTASCVPFALPGVLKKVPGMLLDSESPLKLRWSHVPKALPFFLRLVEASRPSRVEAIAAARNSLLVHTHAGYAPLIEGADAAQWVDHNGLMMVFESEAAFEGAAYALDLRRRNGVHMDILDGNEARQMEPALARSVIKAVSLPDVSRTIDPFRLTSALVQDFRRRGGEIVTAEVRGFAIGSEGPTKLLTDGAPIDVEQVVLAAGVWSRPLARQLGTSVPLEAERGYHVMFAPQDFGLKRALVSADRSVSLAHMHEGIRATGVAEFAAPDAPADMRIADRVMRHARALVPGLRGEPVSRWMGPRPSHPDSKPVIGRSPRHRNVFFAFGHDHLGLTMAGITGKLVAELATGQPTTVDLAPFRPDRF